jgi:hypothetical protein
MMGKGELLDSVDAAVSGAVVEQVAACKQGFLSCP